MGWFKTTEMYYFTILEARSAKSRCQRGDAPSQGSREDTSWLPMPPSNPWHSLNCICITQSLPLSSDMFFLCSCVSPFLRRTYVIRFRAHPNLVWPHLKLNQSHLQRSYFQIKSHSEVLGRHASLRTLQGPWLTGCIPHITAGPILGS